jgi:serine/threonine-protein kinase CHEK1
LFVLLVGNTPWDEPTTFSPEYKYYKTGNRHLFRMDPWNRIPTSVMCISYFDLVDVALIMGLMTIDVERRMTLEQAMQHPWVRK